MIRFQSVPDILQSAIILFNFTVLIINVFCIVRGHVFKSRRAYRFINCLALLPSGVLLFINLTAYADAHSVNSAHSVSSFYNKPVLPLMVLLLFLFSVSLIFLYSISRWIRNYITPASIKDGMDKLPAGLCYHTESGIPRFVNLHMDNLCRYITGEPLFDANDFWSRLITGRVIQGNIIEKHGDNPIITIFGGSTVSFTKIETEIGGEKMYELRATDITKQFSLYNALQQSNSNLTLLNRRLQEYGENVWDITREREILAAKVNIHDMLGKSLLITKRYIEKGDVDVSREELIEMWKANVAFFNGDIQQKEENSSLDELYSAAKIMGIRLTVDGKLPEDNQVLRFVMSGARESLTNAVHHGKAQELTIRSYYNFGFAVIEYTNDGSRPTGTISEGGGLSSLRQRVEAVGGIMETDVYPHFVLRLMIPSKEVF